MTIKPFRKYPLRLDIQFFAESEEDKDKNKKPDDDGGGDDDILTLKDMFKKYPHLRAEHKTKLTDAVTERFKNYDFDPEEAKVALAEKKQRDESGDNLETLKANLAKDYSDKEAKLLKQIKKFALSAHVAKDGLDPKLIATLAADKVESLNLKDDYTLDSDALDEILDDLRTEFPTVFPAESDGTEGAEIPPVKQKKLNPGGQQTNNPPKANEAIDAEVAEIFESIKAKKKHL